MAETPLCRVQLSFEPAFAGGCLPGTAALADAYRFVFQRTAPLYWVLAQNLGAASRAQQVAYVIPFLQGAVKVIFWRLAGSGGSIH